MTAVAEVGEVPTLPRPAGGHRGAGRLPTLDRIMCIAMIFAGQALILANLSVPVVRPVLGIVLLLAVPAVIIDQRVLARVSNRLVAGLLAVGLTVLGIIAVALLLNTVLPWAGVDQPLRRPALVVASTVIDILALCVRARTPVLVPLARRACRRAVTARVEPAVAIGVLAVVLAVAGAIRLNNGLGGATAVAGHAAAVVALAVAACRLRITEAGRVATVALAGAALLLGTSLRGWFITGHDVQNEYLSFLYTEHAHHWVMSVYQQPYNACLSINILPSVLVEYLGVTGVLVFKVVLQLLFAAVPVTVYALARRVLGPRLATLSATFFVVFPTFYTDMPYLVRQEVAYLFLGLAALAAMQKDLPRRPRFGLTILLGLGVVVSHYSTTYVFLITLLLAAAGAGAGAVLRRRGMDPITWRLNPPVLRRRLEGGARPRYGLTLLNPVVVILLAVGAWSWSTPATHSGGHLTDTIGAIVRGLLSGDPLAGSSDTKYNPLVGGGPSEQQRWHNFVADALEARSAGDPNYVLPASSSKDTGLVERPTLPLTVAGRRLQDAGVDVPAAVAATRNGAAALLQLVLVIGLIALIARARLARRIDREMFWLMFGSVAALVVVAVVPGVSADYGVLRAFQQALLLVAPLLAIGTVTGLRWLGRAAVPAAITLAALVGMVLSGAAPALVGGYFAQLAQSNSGQYYDLLYVDSPELSAARWLDTTTAAEPRLSYVTADGIVAITRLNMFTSRAVVVDGDVYPALLRKGRYVFLGPQTVEKGQATVFYTGDLLTYRYPVKQLDGALDLVYSSGGARIYR